MRFYIFGMLTQIALCHFIDHPVDQLIVSGLIVVGIAFYYFKYVLSFKAFLALLKVKTSLKKRLFSEQNGSNKVVYVCEKCSAPNPDQDSNPISNRSETSGMPEWMAAELALNDEH